MVHCYTYTAVDQFVPATGSDTVRVETCVPAVFVMPGNGSK